MSDIALEWDPLAASFDVVIEDNDLKPDAGLQTSIALSLYTDRRAESGDVLPDGEFDRRGWWADAFPVVDADKFGSRLWLLARSKRTTQVLGLAEQYAKEALKWLIDDKVAYQVDVVAEFISTGDGPSSSLGLALTVTVYRPAVDPARFLFNRTWATEAERV